MKKFTHKNSKGAVVVFGFAVALGVFVGRSSWNGAIYLTSTSFSSSLRNPAAIHRDLNETKLNGTDLITGTKNRVITEARVLLEKGEMGLEFGHFVTRDDQGNKQLACEFYDRIRVRFEADGSATGGEKPTMEIEAPCKTGTDINKIEPVWIPVARILDESATDMELTFPEDEGIAFKFTNINGQWPSRWSLSAVQLFNASSADRSVSFTTGEVRNLRSRPLVLAWPSSGRMPTSF